jgi:hypothetical protein
VKPSHMVKFLKDTEYKTWEIRKQAPPCTRELEWGRCVLQLSSTHRLNLWVRVTVRRLRIVGGLEPCDSVDFVS